METMYTIFLAMRKKSTKLFVSLLVQLFYFKVHNLLMMELIGDYEYDTRYRIRFTPLALTFKGRQVNTDKAVAVRIYDNNSHRPQHTKEDIKFMNNEIKSLAHPNILCLFDAFQLPEQICLVTELWNGGDLYSFLFERGTFSEDMVAMLMVQLGSGVCAIHEKGLLHKDLEPSNIVLNFSAGRDVATHTDVQFKIAECGVGDFVMHTGHLPIISEVSVFLAPETAFWQNYSTKCDVWSLGMIALCCYTGNGLVGTGPHNFSVRRDHWATHPDFVPLIPDGAPLWLTDLLSNTLKRNQSERMEAKDLINALSIAFPHYVEHSAGQATVSFDISAPESLSKRTAIFYLPQEPTIGLHSELK